MCKTLPSASAVLEAPKPAPLVALVVGACTLQSRSCANWCAGNLASFGLSSPPRAFSVDNPSNEEARPIPESEFR
jgi:hypothetical protein